MSVFLMPLPLYDLIVVQVGTFVGACVAVGADVGTLFVVGACTLFVVVGCVLLFASEVAPMQAKTRMPIMISTIQGQVRFFFGGGGVIIGGG